jgi:flagellar hook-basal body complex protein FliE
MSFVLPPVQGIAAGTPATATEAAPRAEQGPGLGETFAHVFAEARDYQADATQSAERFAAGDPAMGIHEVMIASEKASISLRYATTLKNKAIEAYHELMQTQV